MTGDRLRVGNKLLHPIYGEGSIVRVWQWKDEKTGQVIEDSSYQYDAIFKNYGGKVSMSEGVALEYCCQPEEE